VLKKILIGVAVVLAGFAAFVATRPADFTITRSATIAAPAPVVFGLVNDFHQWAAWSPWAKLDPAMKETFAGAASGPGAMYSWEGNSEVGAGRMTLEESRPTEHIRIKLEFLKPFAAVNIAEFAFKPEGGQTAVTWTMTGKHNFMSKAVCLFMNMDKMVGGQFETGLAKMKSLAETAKK
jgi:uncharacterized protein YndB with AHSA1/START domain